MSPYHFQSQLDHRTVLQSKSNVNLDIRAERFIESKNYPRSQVTKAGVEAWV